VPPRSESAEPSATPSTDPQPSGTDEAPIAGPVSEGPGAAGPPRLPIPDGLLPFLVLTSAGLGWFFLLVPRRRSPQSTPVALSAASAAVGDTEDVLAVTPLPPVLRNPDVLPGPRAGEVGIPRWLRPSVRQARFEGSRYVPDDNWD
jgi:hypothetical protein